jgi:hypothetical protein
MRVNISVPREAYTASRSIERLLQAENLKAYFKQKNYPLGLDATSIEDLEKAVGILKTLCAMRKHV